MVAQLTKEIGLDFIGTINYRNYIDLTFIVLSRNVLIFLNIAVDHSCSIRDQNFKIQK